MRKGYEDMINNDSTAETLLGMISGWLEEITRGIDFLTSKGVFVDKPKTHEEWLGFTGSILTIRDSLYWLRGAVDETQEILNKREQEAERLIEELERKVESVNKKTSNPKHV